MLHVQSKYKAVKFSCKQRAALLTALYQCMSQAAMRGHCPIALKLLGWAFLLCCSLAGLTSCPCCKRLGSAHAQPMIGKAGWAGLRHGMLCTAARQLSQC